MHVRQALARRSSSGWRTTSRATRPPRRRPITTAFAARPPTARSRPTWRPALPRADPDHASFLESFPNGGTGVYDRVWDRIGEIARLAPSPHNTQPFRIVPRSGDAADVILVRDRLLPREDHGNLYMACAFGIFAAALEQAARSTGRDLLLEVVPRVNVSALHAGAPRVLLGRATLSEAEPGSPRDVLGLRHEPRQKMQSLLAARRTSRLPYHDR